MLLAHEVAEVQDWRRVLPTVLAWLLLALVLVVAIAVYRAASADAYLANGHLSA